MDVFEIQPVHFAEHDRMVRRQVHFAEHDRHDFAEHDRMVRRQARLCRRHDFAVQTGW